ncbi:MAG: nickel-binding protein [Gemmatimonadota bacterium]
MAHVILERSFDPPLTDELFTELTERLSPCLDRNGIAWVRSHLSRDRRRLICHFTAPDTDSVRGALRQARLEHERVWPAEVLEP